MAFKLKHIETELNSAFTATAGAKFTITAEASQGDVQIISARYNKLTVLAAPFTFTTVATRRILLIDFLASNPNAIVTFFESDGANKRPLGIQLGIQDEVDFWIN